MGVLIDGYLFFIHHQYYQWGYEYRDNEPLTKAVRRASVTQR